MKTFSFTLSNGDLSRLELMLVLDRIGIPFRIRSYEETFCIVEAESLLNTAKILGGSFKIGEVTVDSNDEESFIGLLEKAKIIDWLDEKASWGLSFYGIKNGMDADFVDDVQGLVAQKVREAGGRKAKRVLPDIVNADQGIKEVSSSLVAERNLIDFQLLKSKETYLLAITRATVPSTEFQHRDLQRPFQDSTISLSPRIARMLVNFTGVREGETLLDPFCGTGTILMEAATMGVNVVGLDNEGRRVRGTQGNISWLRKAEKVPKQVSVRIRRTDARDVDKRLEPNSINAIATEPILLPSLDRFPAEEEAKNMLIPSYKTYTQVLASIRTVLKKGGRIALVVPYIRLSNRKKAGFEIESLIESSGLRLVSIEGFSFPIIAKYSLDQKVIRGVLLLEKP